VSFGQKTRPFYSRHADRDAAAPKAEGFSVVQPTARTTLFLARSPKEPARIAPEPARAPSDPPRARFAPGGTLIMSVPDHSGSAPSTLSQTRQFPIEQLLSRRAGFNREQELNRELERELALLSHDSETPLGVEDQQALDRSPQRVKPNKRWLRLCMLGLFLGSVAMFFYKPAAEPTASPPSNRLPAPGALSEPDAPGQVDSHPAAAVTLKPHTTLQRAAADIVAEGRYAEALPLYRELAKNEPENSAYAQVVQILEHRIATATKLDPAPP
jgi:hypothetical protein